ncbi:transport permease protein [Amylibacter ulvae]|uniref:Transport permease protein n=2 Tax=Paramylibacter ulvae TaxID=1651968 RepID=A0ABQ3CZ59_9RHOB|nr:transport permease protein [Amylibacter ulvae]
MTEMKSQALGIQKQRFASARTILSLMLREMATSYGKSPSDFFWAVAEPVLSIALLTFVFSLALKSPSLGSNFAIFYASGYLPFYVYSQVQLKIANSLSFSKRLLSYSRVKFTDAIFARLFVNLAILVTVFYFLITAIEWLYVTHTVHQYEYMILGVLMATIMGLGVGTLNIFLFVYVPNWENLWRIVTRPLVFLSAVLYIVEDVPSEYQKYLLINPLTHVTGMVRKGFYPTYTADHISVSYVMGFGLTCFAVGLFFLFLFRKQMRS